MNTELKTEIENHLSEISLVNEKTHIIEKIEGVIKEKYSIDCFLDFLKGNDNSIDSNVILSLLLEKIGEQNIDNVWNRVDESDKDIINLYKKKKNIADEDKIWIKMQLIHLFLVFICKLIDTYFDRIVLQMGIKEFDIDAYCKAILDNYDSCFSEENSKKLIGTRWECGQKAFSVDEKENYPKEKFVLIHGVAGAGKTWLLKKILCEICRDSINSDIDKKYIPIYIELRKYNECDYENAEKKTIMQSMIQNLLEIDSEEYTKLLDKFVLLMDGYDEICDVSDTNSHKKDLTRFFMQTKRYRTRYIVTSRKNDKNIFGSSTTPKIYKFKNVDYKLVEDYFNEYVDDAYREECIQKLKDDLSWISRSNNIIPVMLEAMVVQINNNNIGALINQESFDRIFLIHLLRREIDKNGEQYVKNLNKIMIALAQGTKNGNTGYAREDIEPQLNTVSISGIKEKLDYIVEALYIPLLRIEENNNKSKYYFENENYIKYFLDEKLFELNGALR